MAAKVAKTPEGLKELERLQVASRNDLLLSFCFFFKCKLNFSLPGIFRLKGHAKSVDMATLLLENKKLAHAVHVRIHIRIRIRMRIRKHCLLLCLRVYLI